MAKRKLLPTAIHEQKLINISPYIFPGLPMNRLSITKSAEIILREMNMTMEQIKTRTRKESIRNKRQIMSHLLVWYGFTLHAVGALLGYDHATVLHSYKVVENEMSYNKEMKEFVRRIQHTKLKKE